MYNKYISFMLYIEGSEIIKEEGQLRHHRTGWMQI